MKVVKDNRIVSVVMVIIEGVCGVWFIVEFIFRLVMCFSKYDFVK